MSAKPNRSCCQTKTKEQLHDIDLSLYISPQPPPPPPPPNWSLFYPLIITFLFVIGGALMTQYPSFEVQNFMNNLMGILLITFSYLKLLNPKGFRTSFAKYDLIAFYIPVYGYIYPWIEFTLGAFYCLHLYSLVINSLTILFLLINMGQVIRALLLKKSLECACMGSLGFKLPLSYVTISEDVVMIVMAGVMIAVKQ